MNDKEELLEQLKILKEKQKELEKQIRDVDHVDLYAKNKQYVGKCFMSHDGCDCIRCVLIYDIKTDCTWMSLEIYYYPEVETHFNIEYIDYFNPINDEFFKWIEITRKEFDEHFEEVQKRINLAYSIMSDNYI